MGWGWVLLRKPKANKKTQATMKSERRYHYTGPKGNLKKKRESFKKEVYLLQF